MNRGTGTTPPSEPRPFLFRLPTERDELVIYSNQPLTDADYERALTVLGTCKEAIVAPLGPEAVDV